MPAKPLRIVTYARVSTKSQADRGVSLEDQENRFREFIERTGAVRVRAYAEAKSAGSVLQRKTFVQMFEELASLNVDVLVIDSLDRFTRDMYLGVEQFGKLRDLNVKLQELEYEEDRALNLSLDQDRDYVWKRFGDAEAERRRIKARQLKRYRSQRTRGATTTNRPAFGLRLVGEKGARRLEADPSTAPLVQEVDRRILAGHSQKKVIEWLRSVEPKAWRSRRGLQLALLDEHDAYVKAGVRTPETQAELRALHGQHRQAFGHDRAGRRLPPATVDELLARTIESFGQEHPEPQDRHHDLSGLVACGVCADAIGDPRRALMMGRYMRSNPNPYTIMCPGVRGGKRYHEDSIYVSSHIVRGLIVDKLYKLRDPAVAAEVLARWKREPVRDEKAALRKTLESRLAQIELREVDLNDEVRGAMRLAASSNPVIAAEAERVLGDVTADRLALANERDAVLAEIARLPVRRDRSAEIGKLEALLADAEGFAWGEWLGDDGTIAVASDRELLRPWIDVLGPPIFGRATKWGKKRAVIDWPIIDRARPAHAPDYSDKHGRLAESFA